MSAPKDAVLPPGSKILVTGANGYIGSHVADQLLQRGYLVRGTVRDAAKQAWLTELFDKEYGSGKFEIAEVKELTKDNLAAAMKGCAGVINVASDVSFGSDPNVVVTNAVNLIKGALEAAAAEPSIQRFIQTSSSSAVSMFEVDKAIEITPGTWNTVAEAEAWKPPPYTPDRGFAVYAASKTQQERELWDFVEAKHPHFVANSVLPDYNVGKILNVEKQGYPSSIGMLKALFEGNTETGFMLPPQWEVDVQDSARLHVAALLHPDVKNERVFAYAFPKNNTNTVKYLKELYPERTFPDPPENEGENLYKITARDRAEELLRWTGAGGWTSYKDSIKLVCDTLI